MVHGPGGPPFAVAWRRVGAAFSVVAALAVVGCTVTVVPLESPAPASGSTIPASPTTGGSSSTDADPEASPTSGVGPSASSVPASPSEEPPSPVSSSTPYVVAAGDTLTTIAERFGVTVSQILAANPELADPDQIRAGDTLIIPTPDAASGPPRANGTSDQAGDLVDASDQPAFGPGYGDIGGFGARLDPETVYIEITLLAGPPALDPEVEQLDATIFVDTDGDDEPEARIFASNTISSGSDYGATVEDLDSGMTSAVSAFPGTFTVGPSSFIFEVSRSTLGDPRSYAVAGSLERRFYPGGPSDAEFETTIDRSPDQQYPRANPRWVEIGR